MNPKFLIFSFVLVLTICQTVRAQFTDFVTAHGDTLMTGSRELRFISFNIPNLQYIEDDLVFDKRNPFRLPDEFEIRDALTSIKQIGGQVTRMYTPSLRKAMDDTSIIRHVYGPGVFDEEAFKSMDKALQIANEVGIRIIVPFIDNWKWWGGVTEYALFRGKPRETFWTDTVLINDFKKTIHFIINRVNTYTGVPYKEDKAILGWETGNELVTPDYSWTKNIAAYIKSLDKNHLVIEGTHSQVIHDEALADTNIDVLSTHYYRPTKQIIKYMLEARAKTKGVKPYFVGEFGGYTADDVREVLDSVISSGISGIMIWSLRQHDRDGGFLYHTLSFHWPGFETNTSDEKNIVQLFRDKAFQISGIPKPPISVPAKPKFLPVETPYKISWQGSAGAFGYILERQISDSLLSSPWIVVDSNASDATIAYRPLYSDTTSIPRVMYSYRILAKNESGVSEPSDVVGPVSAPCRILIDDLNDDNRMFEKSDGITFSTDRESTVRAKEDKSRVIGKSGEYIIYKLPKKMISVQVDAFYTTENRDNNLIFFSGDSPNSTMPLSTTKEIYEPFANEYRFFCPIRYTTKNIPANHRYIKIMLNDGMQLGRLEIGYDPK